MVGVQGNCDADLEPPEVDYQVGNNQCVLALGVGGKGLLAALGGAQVVLSNIVVSRSPGGESEPTISATDSSVFMDRAAIIIAEDSAGAAQGVRLRSSRALLSCAYPLCYLHT